MTKSFRSWLPGARALALVLSTSALAGETVAVSHGEARLPSVQFIGWSADEQRYAVRVFSLDDVEYSSEFFDDIERAKMEKVHTYNASRQDKDGYCKGYVDHQGKRFRGGLELRVYEGGKKVLSLPIQDQPRCTDGKVAATRLAEAKKKLAELGIDTGRPGKDHPLESGKRVDITPEKQPPYALEYVDNVQDLSSDDDVGVAKYNGTLDLYVHREGKKEKVFSRKVKKEFRLDMGARDNEALASAHVSPSGDRVVVLGSRIEGGMRGGYSSELRLVTLLGWPESAIAQDKEGGLPPAAAPR